MCGTGSCSYCGGGPADARGSRARPACRRIAAMKGLYSPVPPAMPRPRARRRAGGKGTASASRDHVPLLQAGGFKSAHARPRALRHAGLPPPGLEVRQTPCARRRVPGQDAPGRSRRARAGGQGKLQEAPRRARFPGQKLLRAGAIDPAHALRALPARSRSCLVLPGFFMSGPCNNAVRLGAITPAGGFRRSSRDFGQGHRSSNAAHPSSITSGHEHEFYTDLPPPNTDEVALGVKVILDGQPCKPERAVQMYTCPPRRLPSVALAAFSVALQCLLGRRMCKTTPKNIYPIAHTASRRGGSTHAPPTPPAAGITFPPTVGRRVTLAVFFTKAVGRPTGFNSPSPPAHAA